jgi:hypothetical protein
MVKLENIPKINYHSLQMMLFKVCICGFERSNQKMVNANPKLGINPQPVLKYI